MEQGEKSGAQAAAQTAATAAKDAIKAAQTTANIARGLAAGGVGGIVEAGKEFIKNPKQFMKSLLIVLGLLFFIIMFIALLPLIMFGAIVALVVGVLSAIGNFLNGLPIIGVIFSGIASLFGGGSAPPIPAQHNCPAIIGMECSYGCIAFDNHFDNAHILYNLEQAHEIIGAGIELHYTQLLGAARNTFLTRSGALPTLEDARTPTGVGLPVDFGIPVIDRMRIVGTNGVEIHFYGNEPMLDNLDFFRNTAMVMSMYSASRHDDVQVIDMNDLQAAMNDVGSSAALFNLDFEVIQDYVEYAFIPTRAEHGIRFHLYEWCGDVYCFYNNCVVASWWCPIRLRYTNYDYENFFWYSRTQSWWPKQNATFFHEGLEIWLPSPTSMNGSHYVSGVYVSRFCEDLHVNDWVIRPLLLPVNIHHTEITATGYDAFAVHFGIYGDERLMTFAKEYHDHLMVLLSDTDMGGWFGILLEAGVVEGFYSPFPYMDWRISSPFGMRGDPFSGVQTMHNGIDIPFPNGVPIRAIAAGRVDRVAFDGAGGIRLWINHGYIPGWGVVRSAYMHNSVNRVVYGQQVEAGQHIADVGNTGRSTGPHLHLEIHANGVAQNPVAFIGLPPIR